MLDFIILKLNCLNFYRRLEWNYVKFLVVSAGRKNVTFFNKNTHPSFFSSLFIPTGPPGSRCEAVQVRIRPPRV